MKIIIDENIAFAREAFSGFGEIVLMHGRQINNSALKDADALIVRSITKVNKELLHGTKVKFVGTATIGTDHIDLDYLASQNIAFSDAKGCNADAVAEYVFTVIFSFSAKYNITLKDKTIGIVGVGNIGSRIERLAKATGMKIIKNDPPLKRKTGSADFKDLNDIFNADIITSHVPLNIDGPDKTVHLFNAENLTRLKDNSIFINASRGQVVDNTALNNIIKRNRLIVALDVWENEPSVNLELINKVEIATPHIAGYSLEGKANGTATIYNSICRFLNRKHEWKPTLPDVNNNIIYEPERNSIEDKLADIFTGIYNIYRDDNGMRKIKDQLSEDRPKYFDLLRKNYPLRREFLNYKLSDDLKDERLVNILKAFRVK